MARTVSWLPRLSEIRKSVRESVRSHYRRRDIERLFELQPRAAQHLIGAVAPATRLNRGYLVTREDLQTFLDRIAAGEDAASLLSRRPRPRQGLVLRHLFERDDLPATLDSLPGNVSLEPRRLTINFESMEDLAAGLLAISTALDEPEEFEKFEQRYVPRHPVFVDEKEKDEMRKLFADLEEMEREKAKRKHSPRNS